LQRSCCNKLYCCSTQRSFIPINFDRSFYISWLNVFSQKNDQLFVKIHQLHSQKCVAVSDNDNFQMEFLFTSVTLQETLGFASCDCLSECARMVIYVYELTTEPHAVVTLFPHGYSWYHMLTHVKCLLIFTVDDLYFLYNYLSVSDLRQGLLYLFYTALVLPCCRPLSATGSSLNQLCHSNTQTIFVHHTLSAAFPKITFSITGKM
jgi:hypothetical protein